MSDDQKTLPAAQLEKKRGRRNVGGMASRIALTPLQVEQVNKLAAVGLNVQQIAWVIGISESTLERIVRNDRDRLDMGDPLNAFAALVRGRSQGDALIAQAIFDEAIKSKNASLLQFLAKVRLRWQEPPSEHKMEQTIIFETQIGKDGAIRQQVIEAEVSEPEPPPAKKRARKPRKDP